MTQAKKLLSLLLPLMLCTCLAGCAGKQNGGENAPPALLPPQQERSAAPGPVATVQEKDAGKPGEAPPAADGTGQYLVVDIPADLAAAPRKGEPDALADLLEMKGPGTSEKNTAVNLMRPAAIREAAQTVTLQTAMAYRYKQLVVATEKHSAILDTAFNFSPLLMTHGDALILPPLLTQAGESLRVENAETATTAETTYELLAPARYISTVPTWREFLMADAFPAPEQPNPAVMPKNDKERAIWRAAVREAWAQGVSEADALYADNVARMAREYRGVMLYHLLTAQHLLSRVHTASADLGLKTSDNGNKLNIGQKLYRITAPSAFTVDDAALHYTVPSKEDKSAKVRRK